MSQKFKNLAKSILTSTITSVQTSLTIRLEQADLFPVANTNTDPAPTAGKDFFKIVLQDSSGGIEIAYVRTRALGSAVMSNIIRGQEETAALEFLAGSVIAIRHTAQDMQDVRDTADAATAAVALKADVSYVDSFKDDLANNTDPLKGDAMVGSGDGASGTLWTTIKGFIAYLRASTGAALVGIVGGGTVQSWLTAFSSSQTKTVGSGGDFATLVLALDWAKTQSLTRPIYLNLLEKNTPDTDAGSMAIPSTGYIFDHPNSSNLHFVGPAFGAGQGTITNGAMTGTKAADLAYVKSRYPASIRLNGNDDTSGTFGIAFPNGHGQFDRIFMESKTRYSVDLGFSGSHASSKGKSNGAFHDCAFFGGVWGVISKDSLVNFTGLNWFGYQISGGPIGAFGGYIETDASSLRFYYPTVDTANNPKYCIFADGARLHVNPDGGGSISAKGSFLHGLYTTPGTDGTARGMSFDGVTQPFSTAGNIDISGFLITNASPANTTLVPGATQPGVPGNEGSGALVSSGRGGSLQCSSGTITNSTAARFVSINGGGYRGFNPLIISGSKATYSAFVTAGSQGNICAATITSPQAGSVDQSIANQNGGIWWYGNTSSIAMSPALNTTVAGSGNYA